jgi:hypothetical protein
MLYEMKGDRAHTADELEQHLRDNPAEQNANEIRKANQKIARVFRTALKVRNERLWAGRFGRLTEFRNKTEISDLQTAPLPSKTVVFGARKTPPSYGIVIA